MTKNHPISLWFSFLDLKKTHYHGNTAGFCKILPWCRFSRAHLFSQQFFGEKISVVLLGRGWCKSRASLFFSKKIISHQPREFKEETFILPVTTGFLGENSGENLEFEAQKKGFSLHHGNLEMKKGISPKPRVFKEEKTILTVTTGFLENNFPVVRAGCRRWGRQEKRFLNSRALIFLKEIFGENYRSQRLARALFFFSYEKGIFPQPREFKEEKYILPVSTGFWSTFSRDLGGVSGLGATKEKIFKLPCFGFSLKVLETVSRALFFFSCEKGIFSQPREFKAEKSIFIDAFGVPVITGFKSLFSRAQQANVQNLLILWFISYYLFFYGSIFTFTFMILKDFFHNLQNLAAILSTRTKICFLSDSKKAVCL